MTTAHRWRAFALLAVAFFMTIVDLAIVNVALPTIGRELHFSESNLQWVVTAYGLTFGGFLLLGGRAADLLGRRRIFMVGLAIFTAASLGCALADDRLVPDRAARRAGTRRGDRPARGAFDRHEHVPRGRRAQQGARPLGRHRRERRDRRRDRRRTAHPLRRLGVHLLPQRPDRPRRAAARRRASSRRAGSTPTRRRYDPFGAVTVTARAAAARLRDLEGAARRLGNRADDHAARRVGGLLVAFLVIETPRRGAADAAAHLPAADAGRRERRRLAARRELLRASSSSARSTCSRCSATRRSRPGSPGSRRRSPRSRSPASRRRSSRAARRSS